MRRWLKSKLEKPNKHIDATLNKRQHAQPIEEMFSAHMDTAVEELFAKPSSELFKVTLDAIFTMSIEYTSIFYKKIVMTGDACARWHMCVEGKACICSADLQASLCSWFIENR